jgi:hypothetical protein
MNRKRVWRYYCDFCKKAGCSAGHMASHEKGCTANPNRICRAHDRLSDHQPQRPIGELVLVLHGKNPTEEVEALRELTGGCPMCMLAAIRQCGRQVAADEDGPGFGFPFEFKKELEKAWDNANEAAALPEYYGGY